MKLIDLLVTIAIIVILASALVPVVGKAYTKAKHSIALSSGKNNTRIEIALMDEDERINDKRLAAVLSQ